MYIQKEIHDLRKFVVNDPNMLDKILDILDELNKERSCHVERLDQLREKLDNNEYLIKIMRAQLIQDEKEKMAKPELKEELKPCPCCKSGGISIYYNQNESKTKYYSCNNCGIRTADFATENEARETWQRRPNA